jgi:hypothetical protein
MTLIKEVEIETSKTYLRITNNKQDWIVLQFIENLHKQCVNVAYAFKQGLPRTVIWQNLKMFEVRNDFYVTYWTKYK